jgi:hypothetical protein
MYARDDGNFIDPRLQTRASQLPATCKGSAMPGWADAYNQAKDAAKVE